MLLNSDTKTKILALKGLGGIDLSGTDLPVSEIPRSRAAGGDYYIAASHIGLVRTLRKPGVLDVLGRNNLYPTKSLALAAAVTRVSDDRCGARSARVFLGCGQKPAPPGIEKVRQPKIVGDVYRRL